MQFPWLTPETILPRLPKAASENGNHLNFPSVPWLASVEAGGSLLKAGGPRTARAGEPLGGASPSGHGRDSRALGFL